MTNLQGDIIAIVNTSNVAVVEYVYDAWGNVLSISGSMATTLGTLNPLTYRGYVYDHETGLYYVSSRYYNPAWSRFLNADVLISTGQGLLGNNMFAYCRNNPVSRKDVSGTNDVDCFDSDADPSDDDEEFAGGRMGGGGGSGGNNGSIPVGQANGIGGSGSNSSFSIFSADAVSNGQTGYGQAPPQGPAGTVYTQLSSDGSNTVISQTLYSEYNMPDMRIDYGGHSHGAISGAHIHLFSVYVGPNGIFLNKGPILKCII